MQHESEIQEGADFKGRRILVTGGTRGIGGATVASEFVIDGGTIPTV